MFKELGEFIDNVGRRAGFIAKKILSKDEPHEMDGLLIMNPIEEIDKLVKQGKITKETAEVMKEEIKEEIKNIGVVAKD